MQRLGSLALRLTPLAVLVIGLFITFVNDYHLRKDNRQQLQSALDFRIQEHMERLYQRLDHYESLLHGITGLFNTSVSVERNDFRDYLYVSQQHNHYPEMQCIGFSLWINAADKEQHIAQIRQEGFPTYTIWPEGQRDAYSAGVYLESFQGRNIYALGYDLYADPVQRLAMERARDSGAAALSNAVNLVQDTDQMHALSAILYLPIYARNAPQASRAERRSNLVGWVHVAFRINDLVTDILGTHYRDNGDPLHITLYTENTPLDSLMLFDSHPDFIRETGATVTTLHLRRDVPLPFAGQRWKLVFETLPGFEQRYSGTSAHYLIIFLGLLSTFTLALVMRLLLENRVQVQQKVQSLCRALSESESCYQQIFETTAAIKLIVDPETGQIVDANSAAAAFYGYTREQLLALRITDLDVLPLAVVQQKMQQVITGKLRYLQMQHYLASGEMREVEIYTGPLQIGGRLLLHAVIHDITARKQTEAALYESQALFTEFIRHSPIYMFIKEVTDTTSRTLYASDNYKQMLGIPVTEMLGKTMAEILPADLAAKITTDDWSVVANNKPLVRDETLNARQYISFKFPLVLGDKMLVAGYTIDVTERKQIETALWESKLHLQQLIEAFPETIFETDQTGKLTYLNSLGLQQFRFKSKHTFIPGSIDMDELIVPEQRPLIKQRLQERLQGKLGGYMAYQARRRDGSCFHVMIYSTPITKEGLIIGVRGFVMDISDRKRMELKLLTNQQYTRTILDSLHDAVFIHNAKTGQIIDVNRRACEMYGYSRRDMLWHTAGAFSLGFDKYTPAHAKEWFSKAQEAGPQIFEWASINAAGEPLWLEMGVRFISMHGQQCFIVTGRDIAERRRAEAALRANKEQLDMALQAATMGIWDYEIATNLVTWAGEHARLFGITPSEFGGTLAAAQNYVHPDDRERGIAAFQRTINENAVFDNTYRVIWSDNSVHWLHSIGQLIRDEQGQPQRIMGTTRDISAQRAVEAALQATSEEAQRLARVRSEFLANMSHEIRTPLNAVLGLAQVGQRDNAGRKVQATFDRINDAGQHLLGIINDILDFSKIEAGKLVLEQTEIILSLLIDRVLDLVAASVYAKGLVLQVDEAHDLPYSCQGDGLRLAQILVNLLSNAVKFTKCGQVTLRINHTAHQLHFVVEDAGIGMTAAQLEQLFTPFQQADGSITRRFGGTGLGLIISKRLIELMSGTIRVDSQPNIGSRFSVCLPLREPTPPAAPINGRVALIGLPEAEVADCLATLARHGVIAISLEVGAEWPATDLILSVPTALDAPKLAAAYAGGQTVAVLITPGQQAYSDTRWEGLHELERPLRARQLLQLLTRKVKSPLLMPPAGPRLQGLTLLAAEDHAVNQLVLEQILIGEGAQLVCFQNGRLLLEHLAQHGDQGYALLLTDIQMPELDGYETARRCQAQFPALPIIGLTAHALQEERDQCLAVGMVAHIAKPIEINQLVAVILQHARYTSKVPDAAPAEIAPIETTPISDTVAAIDWISLTARYAKKPAFLTRLLGIFVNTHQEIPGKLRAAADAKDFCQLTQLAHGLKGTSGNLLARELCGQATVMEQLARTELTEALTRTETLATTLEQLLITLAARH